MPDDFAPDDFAPDDFAPDELTPEPEPGGDLVPPPRVPPTALAASTPEPGDVEPRRTRALARFEAGLPPVPGRASLARTIDAALDALDVAGDAIAEAIGLR
jgi:hypothetical protein